MDNQTTPSAPRPAAISAHAYRESGAWGLSAQIDFTNCAPEKMTDFNFFHSFIKALCAHIGMKAHGAPIIDQFGEGELLGYSALQFIETSHMAVHFDDKGGNRVFVDIFSCKWFDVEAATAFCLKELEGSLVSVTCQLRA